MYQKGIQGKLWRILKETYRKIQIRVLHPLISEDKYTQVLRCLPKGSKLSPSLFAIFTSELITELQTKFPSAVTYASTGQVWAGAIAFVDDIVLVSDSLGPDQPS